jgi:hypothetical protein
VQQFLIQSLIQGMGRCSRCGEWCGEVARVPACRQPITQKLTRDLSALLGVPSRVLDVRFMCVGVRGVVSVVSVPYVTVAVTTTRVSIRVYCDVISISGFIFGFKHHWARHLIHFAM